MIYTAASHARMAINGIVHSIFRCDAGLSGILAVVATRMSCDAALGPADAVAVPVVVVGWSFQEWAIHKYLLHGLEVTIASERPLD